MCGPQGALPLGKGMPGREPSEAHTSPLGYSPAGLLTTSLARSCRLGDILHFQGGPQRHHLQGAIPHLPHWGHLSSRWHSGSARIPMCPEGHSLLKRLVGTQEASSATSPVLRLHCPGRRMNTYKGPRVSGK